jgi:hypothetical protein
MEEKATLRLSKKLIDTIALCHKKVKRDTEWSGVLIYDTVEGSVNDPENWVIEAEDMILMDIGTGSYTEYDFDPEDEYSYDTYCNAMMEGKKLGHIHTHHSMDTFFSGTDTSELHDNAPNHNYYLSLIVNYDGKWMAKVAICGAIEQTGSMTTKVTYLNPDGFEEKVLEEAVEDTTEVLYTIDLQLEIVEDVSEETEALVERIKDLSTKTVVYNFGNRQAGNFQGAHAGKTWAWDYDRGVFVDAKSENESDTTPTVLSTEKSTTSSKAFNQWLREDNKYTPGKVRPFLIDLVMGTAFKEDLSQMFLAVKDVGDNYQEMLIDKLEDDIEEYAAEYFDLAKVTDLDMHCISASILDACAPYKTEDFYTLLAILLEHNYILTVPNREEEFRLTGLTPLLYT